MKPGIRPDHSINAAVPRSAHAIAVALALSTNTSQRPRRQYLTRVYTQLNEPICPCTESLADRPAYRPMGPWNSWPHSNAPRAASQTSPVTGAVRFRSRDDSPRSTEACAVRGELPALRGSGVNLGVALVLLAHS